MPEMPSGGVTFLLAVHEGGGPGHDALRLEERAVLHDALALIERVTEEHEGVWFASRAATFCAAFSDAPEALAAAVEAQHMLLCSAGHHSSPPWTLALHTGTAQPYGGRYIAPALSHTAYLLLAAHQGQIVVSATTQRAVHEGLPAGVQIRSLGTGRLRDLLREEPLFDVAASWLPASFPRLRTLDLWPHNLPVQASTLVGRSEQVRRVIALLNEPDGRLVTLHGPGGTGKTRLSLQVGADLLPDCRDGVYFVPLAPVTDPGLVSATIAQSLGIREMLGQPLADSLTAYLMDKDVLLVLDNLEQLLDATGLVGYILERCPRVRILASSRILLHVPGEQRYAVPPLDLPTSMSASVEELVQSPAVMLFMHRAQVAQPGFTLKVETALSVAEICTRLDGLPLAIELAAARVRMISPAELLDGLSSRLTLLTGGARHLEARQQTLRGLIDWSYTLLSGGEQALFARLSVFAGGWTAEAVGRVCLIGDDLPFGIAEGLDSLVDKSLALQQEPRSDGEVEERYMMLETIREYAAYALERLAAVDDDATIHRQHTTYFLELAERAEPELTGPHQDVWLTRLEREHDNLRAALRWCRTNGETEMGLRLAGAMWRFWWVRGHLSEGQGWLEDVLAAGTVRSQDAIVGQEPGAARARALHGLGVFAHYQGAYERAAALYEESLALWRRLDDKGGIAQSLNNLGAMTHEQGDYTRARALHEESLFLRRALGDQRGIAGSLGNLGAVATYQGEYALAMALHQENLAVCDELGDTRGIAIALNNLGDLALRQNDVTQAVTWLAESLTLFASLGDKVYVATLLEGIAESASLQRTEERAARLFGAAAALRNAIGAPQPPSERTAYNHSVEAARVDLGEERFLVLWAEGEMMTLEQAIAYALEKPVSVDRELNDSAALPQDN